MTSPRRPSQSQDRRGSTPIGRRRTSPSSSRTSSRAPRRRTPAPRTRGATRSGSARPRRGGAAAADASEIFFWGGTLFNLSGRSAGCKSSRSRRRRGAAASPRSVSRLRLGLVARRGVAATRPRNIHVSPHGFAADRPLGICTCRPAASPRPVPDETATVATARATEALPTRSQEGQRRRVSGARAGFGRGGGVCLRKNRGAVGAVGVAPARPRLGPRDIPRVPPRPTGARRVVFGPPARAADRLRRLPDRARCSFDSLTRAVTRRRPRRRRPRRAGARPPPPRAPPALLRRRGRGLGRQPRAPPRQPRPPWPPVPLQQRVQRS